MANVPIYNETKVADKHIDLDYQKLDINADMFGAGVLEAVSNLGDSVNSLETTIAKKTDEWNKTKIVDLTNQLDSYTNTALYDKDNGYFTKTGSNAMGQSTQIMADYDQYAQDLIDNSNLKGKYLKMAEQAIAAKKNNIYPSIQKHDADETKSWQTNVYSQKEANIINQGILDRKDDNKLAVGFAQGYNVIDLNAQLQGWDEVTTELKKRDFATRYHTAVIDALLGDGSLRAKQYYEAHKNEIDPDKHTKILNAVNSNDMKYQSSMLADEFMLDAKSENEALEKAYEIENIDLSDATAAKIRQKYSEMRRLETQQENDLIDGFYDVVLNKQQNNQPLTYDDIPDGLSAKTKLSLISYINQNGNPKTDDDTWQQLYYMSVNNAQGFADEDLNKYRGYLSDSEYKSFVKRQEEIKSGKFYTQIKDDDKMITEALKAMGLNRNSSMWWGGDKKDIAYSEIRALTREFEARKGRAITDDELMNITQSLGYKGSDGVMMYKLLEQGMRERTGFIRDVVNDFTYYQQKHNELPSNEEKMKIIQQRVKQKAVEKRNNAEQIVSTFSSNAKTINNINSIVAKPNEQKVLTYFADNQIPEISNDLGLNLVVTSRYRNQQGSHHSEGRAADISMSEHNPQNRRRIYERLLALPTVHKIGTSDPDILTHFKGNQKIVDETSYDRRNGTNHVNHAHITLINYNPVTTETVANNGVYKF